MAMTHGDSPGGCRHWWPVRRWLGGAIGSTGVPRHVAGGAATASAPEEPDGPGGRVRRANRAAPNPYLEAGFLANDNDAAGRALRPVAVSPEIWLFCGSDGGGRAGTVLFSLTATCNGLGVDPFAYLRDVLDRVSTRPAKRVLEPLPGRRRLGPTGRGRSARVRHRARPSGVIVPAVLRAPPKGVGAPARARPSRLDRDRDPFAGRRPALLPGSAVSGLDPSGRTRPRVVGLQHPQLSAHLWLSISARLRR
jgi:hypothetical protein